MMAVTTGVTTGRAVGPGTGRQGKRPVTTLNFLRHGRVENPGKVVYERLPGFHLSDLGRRQARATAEWVASQPRIVRSAAFFSSPLDRTMDTARAVQKAVNGKRAAEGLPPLAIQTDDRLLEAENIFRGQRVNHGEAAWYRHGNLFKFLNLHRPGWGELYAHIAQRMTSFAFEKADEYPGQNLIVVSHESPIWTLRRYLETGRSSTNVLLRHTGLASVTSLEIETGTHRLVGVGYHDPAKDVE